MYVFCTVAATGKSRAGNKCADISGLGVAGANPASPTDTTQTGTHHTRTLNVPKCSFRAELQGNFFCVSIELRMRG